MEVAFRVVRLVIQVLVFVPLIVIVAQSNTAYTDDQIIGTWYTKGDEGKIRFYKKNHQYYGTLIWGIDLFEADGHTSKKDIQNEDAKLRNRTLQYLDVVSHLEYKNGSYTNGTVYDPHNGKTYQCTISLVEPNKLEIRGYIGISLFGRSEIWRRVP